MEKNFNYKKNRMYLLARSPYEGYLIEAHDHGTDIVKVQPRELIIERKKIGEFRTLTVSKGGLADPGSYGEVYDGNQVYEVEIRSDLSYKLRPRNFVPAGFGLASSIPVMVKEDESVKLANFDMAAAEYIIRAYYKISEFADLRDAVERVYDSVLSNPCISGIADFRSVEEAFVDRAMKEEEAAIA